MAQLFLYFVRGDAPELSRVLFSHHALPAACESVRGKTSGAYGSPRTFQWSVAVRALCVLLAQTAARIFITGDNRAQSSSAVLEGGPGTPAAALDSAIGKHTDWLVDMFGVAHGKPLALRLFRRSNPDRKRAGPAAVALNMAAYDGLELRIFVDGCLMLDAQALLSLACRIAGPNEQKMTTLEFRAPTNSANADGSLLGAIRNLLRDEITSSLHTTDIFVRQRLQQTLEQIHHGVSFRKVAGKKASLASEIDAHLSGANRIGLCDDETRLRRHLCGDAPLRVALGVPSLGAAAIFFYLTYIKRYHFELNVNHVHAVEIARRIIRRQYDQMPDICCLGVAPAATLLAHGAETEFRPLLILPRASQGIVVPEQTKQGTQRLDHGEYYFIDDDPSVPSFLFEELSRKGWVSPKKVIRRHLEPDETFSQLKEGDPGMRAILFFPHYQVNRLFNSCRTIPLPPLECNVDQMVLFVHQHLFCDVERAQCLDLALRNAWLELKTSSQMRETVLDLMVSHPDYRRTLLRSAGLYNLDNPEL